MKNYGQFRAKFVFLRGLLESTLQGQPEAIQQGIRVDLLASADMLIDVGEGMRRSDVRDALIKLAERSWSYSRMSRFDDTTRQCFLGAVGLILEMLVKISDKNA